LGISPGKYNVRMLQNGQEVFHFNGFPVSLDENVLDFDLQKEQGNAAKGQGISPEEMKRRQEVQQKAAKENETVKALNEKPATSRAAIQAGNYDQAIAAMTEATQTDPNRDL